MTTIFGALFYDQELETDVYISPWFWRTYFNITSIFSLARIILILKFVTFETPLYYVNMFCRYLSTKITKMRKQKVSAKEYTNKNILMNR